MKISVVFSGKVSSAWSVSDGILHTLVRMGHEVTGFCLGRSGVHARVNKEILHQQDLIILSGLEHFMHPKELSDTKEFNFLNDEMDEEAWKSLKVPTAVWYHESFVREDQNYDFTRLIPFADHHFFPAQQDVEMLEPQLPNHVHHLPFGVDLAVFRAEVCYTCAGKPSIEICTACYGSGFADNLPDLGVGFIGGIYPKRQFFLQSFLKHCKVPLHIGSVIVQDMDGINAHETALRLARNYRRCKVFLNFPSLSRLLVTKVIEVMACGTMLMTPMLDGDAACNMDVFESPKHLIYYAPKHLGFLNQTLQNLLEHEADRKRIALAGMAEVRKNHSLRSRLETMLEVMGVEKKVEVVN